MIASTLRWWCAWLGESMRLWHVCLMTKHELMSSWFLTPKNLIKVMVFKQNSQVEKSSSKLCSFHMQWGDNSESWTYSITGYVRASTHSLKAVGTYYNEIHIPCKVVLRQPPLSLLQNSRRINNNYTYIFDCFNIWKLLLRQVFMGTRL